MKPKKERPPWYGQTVERLSQYPINQETIESLEQKLKYLVSSGVSHYGPEPSRRTGPSDQTGNIASKRADLEQRIAEIEQENHMIKFALSLLDQEKRDLIEMKYLSPFNTDIRIAVRIGLSMSTYYSQKDKAIKEIAIILGYCNLFGN